ncbi:MAG: DNA helicase RecQ [Bacteroidetes bacterium B1(2017)]|nr:MAG: DNA helicase RecQ [Bacteroidetes bacterium B1(2017)]
MAAAKRVKETSTGTTPDLKEALRNYFGFDSFKGEQEEIIHNLLSGNDTFVIMPTGGGKSVCYQLPALIMPGTAIIISPLIALMKNQVDAIRSLSHESVAHFLNSSLNKGEITAVKKDINAGQTKMLYIAPETLKKDETIEFLKTIDISFVAVDEAHCISEWGHDFRPEYRRIKQMVKEIKDVPMIALTATATPKVQSDIIKNLQMTEAVVYKSSFNRSNLYYEVRSKGKKGEAIKEIVSFIKARPNKTGIIYCLSRKRVDEISGILQANGIKALAYHAGLDAKVRADHQDKFLMEDADVIVATIAFGMGIDKPDVRFVIHYDIPKSIEGYYQETGRGGRDGLEGECILFYNPADIEKLEKFLKDKPVAEREIGELLIFETEAFAESAACRRKFLLHYFGEEFPEKDCNKMCDNCRHPKEKVDGKEAAIAALKMIKEIKGKYNLKHCVDILIGSKTHEVAMSGHHELSSFGVGKDKDENYWKSVIRQLLLRGMVTKNIENYGLISINDVGEAYLKKPIAFEMAVDRKFERFTDTDEDDSQVEAVYDEVLFSILKDLCKKVAKAKNLPPYIVFQEPSLQEMAFKYPITMEELSKITGVSAGKAQKFGKEFLGVIEKYVTENNIERTEDVTIKSVVNKSARKIAIITNIDKRVSLDDIARGQGIKKEELLEEIENIVNSGTKLNLSRYVHEVTEEDIVEEVMDFFRKTNDNVLEAAMKEYGEEFSKDDIHLLHIHFVSEMAN